MATDGVEIPSFREWLEDTYPTPNEAIPHSFTLGSFRGQLVEGDGVFPFEDFGLALMRNCVIGKGVMQGAEFSITGQFGILANGTVRVAMSMDFFSPPEEGGVTPATPKSSRTNNPATPNGGLNGGQSFEEDIIQNISSRLELRCEISNSVEDADSQPHGPGIIGCWFRVSEEVITQGDVVLWATPENERRGGLLTFVFDSAICGVEHTGSYAQWHGIGAEIKRVQEPALSLGIRAGDVIRSLNGVPLPSQRKSLDISKLIKQSVRPLHLVVWRDVSIVKIKLLPIVGLEAVDEDSVMEPATPSSASVSTALNDTFNNMQTLTADLRTDMMGEILKKRQSLDVARKRTLQRRMSSVES